MWEGEASELIEFLEQLNNNDRNIVLTWDVSPEKINFLDLEISLDNSTFSTKTHFKGVDRNSYLPIESCHHKNWIFNIPKGQLMRIKRNCTKIETYFKQAEKIGERFMSKGYDRQFIKTQIAEVSKLDRNELIKEKIPQKNPVEGIPLILDFNAQHRKTERIIKRHWHILLADSQLQGILPKDTKFIYKRAPTIRDLVVKNVVDPPKKMFSFFTGKGFFLCKRCFACLRTKRPNKRVFQFTSTSTGESHDIKDFICCNTEGAVYVLECSCGLQYVGRTKRPLRVRIKEHVKNIINGYDKHCVSKHFLTCHNKDPTHLTFWGIIPYTRHWQEVIR